MKMLTGRRHTYDCCAALCIILSYASTAEDIAPQSENDVRVAMERGEALRKQAGAIPEILIKEAFILKYGNIRYGNQSLTIESVTDGTATYKLNSKTKSVSASIEYGATYMDSQLIAYLDSDLSLISEKNVFKSTVFRKGDNDVRNKIKSEIWTSELMRANDSMDWTVTYDDGVAPTVNHKKLNLYGAKPIHRWATTRLASLAVHSKYPLDPSKPICVWYLQVDTKKIFSSEPKLTPIWVIFDQVGTDSPSFDTRIRRLSATTDERGLRVTIPSPEQWKIPDIWKMDSQGHVVVSPTERVAGNLWRSEKVAWEKLDPDEHYDLKAIAEDWEKQKTDENIKLPQK